MKKILMLSLLVTMFVAIGTVAKARDDYAARSSPKIELKKNTPVIIMNEMPSPVIAQVSVCGIGYSPVIGNQKNATGKNEDLSIINYTPSGQYPDIDERLCFENNGLNATNEKPPLKIRPVKRE